MSIGDIEFMDVLSFGTIADHIKREINHKCSLNISQTRILLFFDHNQNQALTMGKLADELHISLSTLSRQLQQKKTRSVIEITRSDKSSSKNVHLNEDGLTKVKELKQALIEIQQEIFSKIDKNKLRSFTDDLELLSKEYSNLSEMA